MSYAALQKSKKNTQKTVKKICFENVVIMCFLKCFPFTESCHVRFLQCQALEKIGIKMPSKKTLPQRNFKTRNHLDKNSNVVKTKVKGSKSYLIVARE